MDNNATSALQLYTPGVINIIVDLLSSAAFFGILTVLAIVSAVHLIRRDVKRPSTAFMLGSLMTLYASTGMHVGAVIAYSVGYRRLLNDAVSALSPGSSVDMAIVQFQQIGGTSSYIASFALVINMTVGDAIVLWRAYVLWQQKPIIVLGTVVLAVMSGLSIYSIILHQSTEIWAYYYDQLFLRFANVYAAISTFGSLSINVTATLLIGWKAWEHRKIWLLAGVGCTSKARWITPTMRILILLVESGTIYSAFLALIIADNLFLGYLRSLGPHSNLNAEDAKFLSAMKTYLPVCLPPIVAIYPTVIIAIVALNRSPIEGSLGHSIAFRGGPNDSDVHIALRDTAGRNGCTLDTVEDRSPDSEESPSQGTTLANKHDTEQPVPDRELS